MLKNKSDRLTDLARDLLQRAGRCYAAAGWGDDACRVYEQLGDFQRAAVYHEQQGRWLEAGQCYESMGEWQRAARCFMKCDEWEKAAECLGKSGEMIEAGWLWAHRLHRYRHARESVQRVEIRNERDRLGFEVVLSRCEIGLDEPAAAAVRMKNIISMLAAEPDGEERRQYVQRALEIAKILRRPDLAASIYASGVLAKVSQAGEQWEAWAIEELGDASGIPVEKIEGEKVGR
jgi:tetratricopeptide (TPR) repeat protein